MRSTPARRIARVEDVVAAHHGAGVGTRCPGRCPRVPARLHDHHRLDAGHGAQRAHEAPRVPHVLDVQHDAVGRGVAAGSRGSRRTRRRNRGRSRSPWRSRPGACAPSRGSRHRSRPTATRARDGLGSVDRGPQEAFSRGRCASRRGWPAEVAQAVRARPAPDLGLELEARRTVLAEPGRDDHRRRHAEATAVLDDAGTVAAGVTITARSGGDGSSRGCGARPVPPPTRAQVHVVHRTLEAGPGEVAPHHVAEGAGVSLAPTRTTEAGCSSLAMRWAVKGSSSHGGR